MIFKVKNIRAIQIQGHTRNLRSRIFKFKDIMILKVKDIHDIQGRGYL